MKAVLSGRSAVAFLVDGDDCRKLDMDVSDEFVRCDRMAMRDVLRSDDVAFVADADENQARETIRFHVEREEAFDLALFLLDGQLEDDTRQEAARELEALLPSEAVTEWVESILFSKPLPPSADVDGGQRACDAVGRRAAQWLAELSRLQPQIGDVRRAWQAVPDGEFDDETARRRFESVLIDRGSFRRVVLALDGREDVGGVRREALRNLEGLPNHQTVLSAFFAALPDPVPSRPTAGERTDDEPFVITIDSGVVTQTEVSHEVRPWAAVAAVAASVWSGAQRALDVLDDRVVVEPLAAEVTTAGGIVLPDTAREKPQRGKVVAVGPGRLLASGERRPISVVIGDEVLFGKYGGTEIEVEGTEVKILRESDILAKLV